MRALPPSRDHPVENVIVLIEIEKGAGWRSTPLHVWKPHTSSEVSDLFKHKQSVLDQDSIFSWQLQTDAALVCNGEMGFHVNAALSS